MAAGWVAAGTGAPGNGRGAYALVDAHAALAPSAAIAAATRMTVVKGTDRIIGRRGGLVHRGLTACGQGRYGPHILTPARISCQNHIITMEQTLLLNATYEPLKVVHWRKAVTLYCQGKVEVISVYEDREIRSVSFAFKLPSVIRLLRRIRIKRRFDYVPFSRANIYARDNHSCQYCGKPFPSGELTFDHVVPVAQGGRKDWENIVSCCITCNRRKGGRTPAQAHMALIRPPRRPEKAPAIRITFGLRNAPESWRDYVYWNVELDDA